MKFPLPADTFPKLELSQHEKHMIEAAAEEIVKTTIKQYYELLTVHNGVVDETRWKKLKQREDVRVYMERKSSLHSRAASVASDESTSTSSASSTVTTTSTDIKTKASMLTFGSVAGHLDDVMYGVLSPSTEEMQLKTACVGDGLDDWGLLASIIKPSEKDPFRALSIKWSVKDYPLLLSAVVRTRDSVYIESSGIAMTPSGERIGYRMDHSVNLPGVRELTELKIVRSNFSACEFFRQRTPACVEVYSLIQFNPMGDVSATAGSQALVQIPIRVFKHLHYAEMKKLARLLRSSRNQSRSVTSTELSDSDSRSSSWNSVLSSVSSSTSPPPPGACELCSQRTTSGGRGFSSLSSSKEKQCRICQAHTCARCCAEKTIYSPTDVKKQLASANMTFCKRCILGASNASSFKFAVLDALESEGELVNYREALIR